MGFSSVDYWQTNCVHQPAGFVLPVQACVLLSCDVYWLPTPFSCFPFISPPVRHRVPITFQLESTTRFYIRKFYMVLASCCFVRIPEQTATFALYVINWLVFITVVESVYTAVRTDCLYRAFHNVFRAYKHL
jgi:hypothetical protein